ncbi:MAG: flagellar hook-basal body complex protein, partial [Pseudothermotoga sp.]|nr:flagellar hook-basal body complex protein [Pseudothermotoga sp.]
MTQGSFQNTGRKLDLAIQGDGFFVLSDGRGYYYTRAGALDVDMNGTLIHASTGLKVQGWRAVQDPATGSRYVDTNQPIGDIVISAGMTMPARATTAARIEGNLNSTSGILPFSMTVTDDNGKQHTVRFVFSKTEADIEAQDDPFAENQRYTWTVYDENNDEIASGYIVINQFGRVVEAGGYVIEAIDVTASQNGQLQLSDIKNGSYDVTVVDSNGNVIYQRSETVTNGQLNITDTDIQNGQRYKVILMFKENTVSNVTASQAGKITNSDIDSSDIPPDGIYDVQVKSGTTVIYEGKVTISNGNFTIEDSDIQQNQQYSITFFNPTREEITVATGASISIPTAGEIRFYESDNPSNFVTAQFNSPRYVTAVQVYDTLGNPYSLHIEFIRLGKFDTMNNAWIWRVYTASGEPITYIDAEGDENYAGGIIDFNDSGRITAMYGFSWNGTDFTVGNTELRTIRFDASHMGDGTVTINLDLTALTQFAGANSASFTWQNGNALGALQSFAINENGEIIGTFSNGLTDILGQIALAIFNNPAGLTEVGNSLYVPSANSGLAQIGAAGTGGRGTLIPGALEMSNVDLAE